MTNMIKLLVLFMGAAAIPLLSCGQSKHSKVAGIDPGRYDTTWWNHTPMRFIQTNLNEMDARMNTDVFVKAIEDASCNLLLLNVGGIVANYPTKLPYHYLNPYMKGDMAGELIQKLHAKGIRVIGRFDFSKLNEKLSAKKPEWLYVGTDGKIVNYNGQVHTCVNGGYQQQYAFEILREAISAYPMDGIFFNSGGYKTDDYSNIQHGICQCENCKKRFYDSTGLKLPVKVDFTDPVYVKYRAFQLVTSREVNLRIKSLAKELRPNMILGQEVGEILRTESGSNYAFQPDWNYHATENVKKILGTYKNKTPNDTYNYLLGLEYRHTATSPNIGRILLAEQMLNGASLGTYFMGRLEHQDDRVFLPELNALYGFHKANEKLFTNLRPLTKVGLIMGAAQEYRGIMKLLIEEHIMFDLIQASAVGSEEAPRKLEEYDALILGNVSNMSDDLVARIDEYVKNGGRLLATGFPGINNEMGIPLKSLRLQSIGVKPDFGMFPQTKSTYLKIEENDKAVLGQKEFADFDLMMMNSDFLNCKINGNAKSYLKLVANTMYGPPEKSYFEEDNATPYPGVIVNGFGKGRCVFIPWALGSQYAWKGNNAHRALFLAAMNKVLQLENPIVTNASPLIEMTHMANRNGAFEWIGMINHTGQIGAAFREPAPIHNTAIRFKPAKPVKEIYLARAGSGLSFKQSNGWVECVVPQLKDFEMVVVLYK